MSKICRSQQKPLNEIKRAPYFKLLLNKNKMENMHFTDALTQTTKHQQKVALSYLNINFIHVMNKQSINFILWQHRLLPRQESQPKMSSFISVLKSLQAPDDDATNQNCNNNSVLQIVVHQKSRPVAFFLNRKCVFVCTINCLLATTPFFGRHYRQGRLVFPIAQNKQASDEK